MRQQHLLKAPCVRLKPYLRRLEMSLNRLERLEDASKQTKTLILLRTPIKNLSFNLSASTTPFETPFVRLKPYLRPREASWSRRELSRSRLGATKNTDNATHVYQKTCLSIIRFNNTC